MSFFRVTGWLETVKQDLRVALRGLRRDPGFALTAIITLALGLGANTAIFVLADALLFKPVFARDPARLVALTATELDNPPGPIPSGVVDAIRREQIFSAVCGFLPLSVTVDIRGRIAPIQAHPITGDCFEALGIRPTLGRLLTIDDERQGSAHVAVITYDTWTRDFGASPTVLGETVNIDGTQYAVVGVTERGFSGVTVGMPTRLFLPFGNFAGGLDAYFPPRTLLVLTLIGRLRDGDDLPSAASRLHTRWPAWLAEAVPPRMPSPQRDRFLARTLSVASATTGVDGSLRRRFRSPLLLLLGISGVVLLVTCLNSANLLLARAAARRREAAVRAALGASRGRLIRESAIESLLLLLAGAGAALILAMAISRSLIALFGQSAPDIGLEVAVDVRVLEFMVSVLVLAFVVFALVPALRASQVQVTSLGSMSARNWSDHRGLRRAAVGTQVALTVMLLSAGALFIGSFRDLINRPLGLSVDRVVSAQLTALPGGYDRQFASSTYYRSLVDRLEAEPAIERVALTRDAIFSNLSGSVPVAVDGTDVEIRATQSFASDRFFDTLGLPIIAGTAFGHGDSAGSPRTAVISQSAARALFGDAPAVGRIIRVGAAPINQHIEIVGIAADASVGSLQSRDTRIVYLNFWQFGAPIQTYPMLLVKSRAASTLSTEYLDRLVRVGGREYVSLARTLDTQRDAALVNERLLAVLSSLFAVLGLALAAVGLHGLLAFLVTERTAEIGVRIALGARRLQICGLVLRSALTIVGIGAALGVLLALAGGRVLAAAIPAGRVAAWSSIATAVAVMLGAAVVAALIPTRRAASLDPATALRHE
jgi:predicted permease